MRESRDEGTGDRSHRVYWHPRVPLTGVKMARKYMYFDCSKAVRELHMSKNPVERAIEKAIEWFRNHGYVKSFHEALNV